MTIFAELKRSPATFVARTLALGVLLAFVYINLNLLPGLINKIGSGKIFDIPYNISDGQARIIYTSQNAENAGVMVGDIVLNPEGLYSVGKIGDPVTLLIESQGDDSPVREVTFFRQPFYPNDYIGTIFPELPAHAALELESNIILGATIFVGALALLAYWMGADALLAFLFMVSFSQLFFSPLGLLWVLFRQILPSAFILFLILFPNGVLAPRWSWLLIFLPLPNLLLNLLFKAHATRWISSLDYGLINLIDSVMPALVLVIFGFITYWHRESLTSLERKRVGWLIFGLFLIFAFRFLWTLRPIAQLIPDQGVNYYHHTSGAYEIVIFRLNRIVYSIYKSFRYIGAGSLLIVLGNIVYRYLRALSPVEKQQVKWLAFGLVVGEASLITSYIFLAYFFNTIQIDWEHLAIISVDNTRGSYLDLVFSVIDKLLLLEAIVLALCAFLALRRYRLDDVDTYINRALVYGGLAIIAGALFSLIASSIDQTLGRDSLKLNGFLSIVIWVVLIAAAYNPVRTWLQKLANEYFPSEI